MYDNAPEQTAKWTATTNCEENTFAMGNNIFFNKTNKSPKFNKLIMWYPCKNFWSMSNLDVTFPLQRFKRTRPNVEFSELLYHEKKLAIFGDGLIYFGNFFCWFGGCQKPNANGTKRKLRSYIEAFREVDSNGPGPNGAEFVNKVRDEFVKKQFGIKTKLSMHYHPEANGATESVVLRQ